MTWPQCVFYSVCVAAPCFVVASVVSTLIAMRKLEQITNNAVKAMKEM